MFKVSHGMGAQFIFNYDNSHSLMINKLSMSGAKIANLQQVRIQ